MKQKLTKKLANKNIYCKIDYDLLENIRESKMNEINDNRGNIQEQTVPTTLNSISSREYRLLHVRPWVRFFARNIDLFILGFCFGIFALFYPPLITNSNILNGIIILFVWFLLEPIFLSTWGTTLGKYLLNIKVTDLNNRKPQFYQNFSRSFWVLTNGYGWGVPIVYLFTLYSSYNQLDKTGTTSWDKDKFIVTHGKIGVIRIIVASTLVALGIFLSIWGNIDNNKSSIKENSSYDDTNEIASLNKGLPKKLDDETELTKIYLENNTLNYQYKLLNYTSDDLNITAFTSKIRPWLVQKTCSNNTTKSLLLNNQRLSYNYLDKNGVLIEKIVIQSSDCP